MERRPSSISRLIVNSDWVAILQTRMVGPASLRYCTDSRSVHPSSHNERIWVQVLPDSRPTRCCPRALRLPVCNSVPHRLSQSFRVRLLLAPLVRRRRQTKPAPHARLYPPVETMDRRTP